jgi:alkanesulfonate monooxygenase SsuD/methylene tetrahydromethanopterin reductase-like flavin-dependent oxidoreductase (luciferase family)
MKFSLFYFPQLGMGDPTTYERGKIGNDPDQFAYLLEDLKLQAQLAEEIGFYGVYFAEHHFDVEGFEMAHNPLLFDSWIGMHTERLKLGQLGLVLPNWNPLRLAEDVATMAHMWGDRFELGFARGFQTREVAPLAAAHQVEGALSDHSEADQRNRRLFTETYDILKKALTQDFFHHEGEFYTIPPKDLKWLNPATQKYGGGVAPDGTVTDLSVVPKLPARKLPLRWQAFSFSPETMQWAAREQMNLAMFEIKPKQQIEYQQIYQQESESSGRPLGFGEGIGYVRGMLCLDDAETAHRYNSAAVDKLWGEWFAGTGFTQAFRTEADPPDQWLDYSYEMICDRGFDFTGTPDHVTRQIEALHENTNMEHLFIQYNCCGVPRDILLKSLETFAEKVMPRFDVDLTTTTPATAEPAVSR